MEERKVVLWYTCINLEDSGCVAEEREIGTELPLLHVGVLTVGVDGDHPGVVIDIRRPSSYSRSGR